MSIISRMESAVVARPFLKWAGGKQALAEQLVERFPTKFAAYYEPFLGGGSVYFTLAPRTAVLGDANAWLIETFEAVRKDWREVAAVLGTFKNTKQDYLKLRRKGPAALALFERAALFIYLNKTCFRGLFRVNREGVFNVPYGAYKRRYFDPIVLHAAAERLRGATLRCGDFEASLAGARRGDFVYVDPPYYKLGGYSDFNRYTSGQFREDDHLRLAAVCRCLDSRGVRWAVSNSDTPFVRAAYRGFQMERLSGRREINLNSGGRDVPELLIRNY